MEKRAYKIAEFCKMFSLNEQTVRVNVSRRPELLPRVLRVGRSVFFTADAIKKWEKSMQE